MAPTQEEGRNLTLPRAASVISKRQRISGGTDDLQYGPILMVYILEQALI